MSLDLNRQTWGVHDSAAPEEKEAAARYVASVAEDAADCRELLDALGLLPKHLTVVEHGMPGYRAGCKCPVCMEANRIRNQEQRAVAAAPTNTTTNRGTTS
jgi:hypothetical protein